MPLPDIVCAKESPTARIVALHLAMTLEPGVAHVVKPSAVAATLQIGKGEYEAGHREASRAKWITGIDPCRVFVPWDSLARKALGLPTAPPPETPPAPRNPTKVKQ